MTHGTLKETDPLEEKSPIAERSNRKGIKLSFLAGGAIFIAIAIMGVSSRTAKNARLQQQSNEAAQITVSVIHPEKAATIIPLHLPGQTKAYIEAPIFAQTSGYLKKWYFDIGAKVKAGDVLAEIDTPQLDQQFNQAKAQLKVAESARDLAGSTFKRDQDLFNRKVIAAQDFDTASDTYRQTQATVNADQASLNALNALEGFKTVKAPFDGIVTERDTDIGAFVPSGTGVQLFRMAQTSPLRVYINVPQTFARFIKPGVQAELTLNELPDRKYRAHVTNTAGAIDPTSRTLLTELEVPNETEELLPGAYAQISLKLEGDSGLVTVPSNTLLFRSEGPSVGVVHSDGKIEIRKIVINRDLGSKLQISQGLSESDQVVLNPSDGLTDGMAVNVATPKPTEKPAAKG
ncbi:MAG: efflux RND transporter periplasmic adaptor subunit [Verrucomicrobia bacterium]|nr:efflux RND transporter periplasmic adaptor subunit [Verrucomicrobiota bacterium]MBV9643962.1 efflux RND transporter periplasmic adaptor subunit [Verrucomicrobiota bacterium]